MEGRVLAEVARRQIRSRASSLTAITAVVLAGMGLLVYIWLANNAVLRAARNEQRAADFLTIQTSLSLYRYAEGRYPATLDELVPLCLQTTPEDPCEGKPHRDPQWRALLDSPTFTYRYILLPSGQGYELLAAIEGHQGRLLRVVIGQ